MHQAVPGIHNSALHFAYIANKFQLLISLENSFQTKTNTSSAKTKTKTKTKTAE